MDSGSKDGGRREKWAAEERLSSGGRDGDDLRVQEQDAGVLGELGRVWVMVGVVCRGARQA